MTKYEVTIIILKDYWLTITGVLGWLLLISDIFISSGSLSIIGFLLIFNWFDLLGYRNVLHAMKLKDSAVKQFTGKELPSYRIMQTMFEICLILFIMSTQGIIIGLLAKLVHWFGVQDIIYYLVGKYKFPKVWTWLYWTPLGLLWKDKTIGIPNIYIILQAIIGLILVFTTMWFL